MDVHINATDATLAKAEPKEFSSTIQNEEYLSNGRDLSKKGFMAMKDISTLKAIGIRFTLLIVALLCFTGFTQRIGNRLMAPVFDYDQQYLEKSLKNIGGSIFVLLVPKGVLEAAETIELEPSGATVKIGSAALGKIFKPLRDIVDNIWDYLVLLTYLVLVQIVIIKLAGIISIKFFLLDVQVFSNLLILLHANTTL